ncbi:Peptide exporter [Forsythia ovata]|uniref:Peptide exporter n=1 Tax=Forsythia ovata TaxID=205694 RepID=A0ABD1VDA8_9LAMI
MKDGRITQDGKYNDILKSGSDFMELVGAHKEALSALDSIEAGAAVVGEDSSTGNAKNFLQKKESPTDQNDKTDNAMGTNGQLIQLFDFNRGEFWNMGPAGPGGPGWGWGPGPAVPGWGPGPGFFPGQGGFFGGCFDGIVSVISSWEADNQLAMLSYIRINIIFFSTLQECSQHAHIFVLL